MTDGLEYFKKVYNVVPDWVQKMYDYNPLMLNYYTDIRGEAFKDTSYLSAKEKDLFITSVNAGRLYERSMIFHCNAGLIKGATIDEMIEYYLVAYIYKGVDSLKLSMKAVDLLVKDKDDSCVKDEYADETEIVEQLLDWTKDNQNAILLNLHNLLKEGKDRNSKEVFDCVMSDGVVSSKKKYLNLIGQYLTELNGKGAQALTEKSKLKGVSEADLAELGYIVMITAGIPSWFELCDVLNDGK